MAARALRAANPTSDSARNVKAFAAAERARTAGGRSPAILSPRSENIPNWRCMATSAERRSIKSLKKLAATFAALAHLFLFDRSSGSGNQSLPHPAQMRNSCCTWCAASISVASTPEELQTVAIGGPDHRKFYGASKTCFKFSDLSQWRSICFAPVVGIVERCPFSNSRLSYS